MRNGILSLMDQAGSMIDSSTAKSAIWLSSEYFYVNMTANGI